VTIFAHMANDPKSVSGAASFTPPILPEVITFDYGMIEPAAAVHLRACAGQIRGRVRNMTADIIAIGRDLLEIKRMLVHGQFVPWVEAECGFTAKSAERYMRAADLAEGKIDIVSNLPPTVVYELAAKSAPADVVEAVIASVKGGEIPSADTVSAMLKQARRQRRKENKKRSLASARKRRRRKADTETFLRRQEQRALDEKAAAARLAESIVNAIGIEHAEFVSNALLGAPNQFLVLEALAAAVAKGGSGMEGSSEARRDAVGSGGQSWEAEL
jgi:hypothetical protein